MAHLSFLPTVHLHLPPFRIMAATTTDPNVANLDTFIHDIVQFMAAGAGIMMVLMLAWAGFRYLTAGDNSSQVQEAKNHIKNVVWAFVFYMFGLALLNWLSPGGIG